jgi:hypothetical protein
MECKAQFDDDGEVRCSVCGRGFPLLTEKDLVSIGRDLTKIHRRCVADPTPDDDRIAVVQAALDAMPDNPLPLGDWTAAGLDALGITKERVNAWKGEIGPCQSCVERQEWWNKLGEKIAGFLRGKAERGDSAA